MNTAELAIVVLAWGPVFMTGLYVGTLKRKTEVKEEDRPSKDLLLTKAEPNDLLGFPKPVIELAPISIKPANSQEWHPADEDGDTIDQFPKAQRSVSFADDVETLPPPPPVVLEESGVVPSGGSKRFKSSEIRRYSSGELKAVPEIKKRAPSTPSRAWAPTSYSKIDRT